MICLLVRGLAMLLVIICGSWRSLLPSRRLKHVLLTLAVLSYFLVAVVGARCFFHVALDSTGIPFALFPPDPECGGYLYCTFAPYAYPLTAHPAKQNSSSARPVP